MTTTTTTAAEPERCAICAAADLATIQTLDSAPLCARHWSRWVATFCAAPYAPLPPCAAHLIGAPA